MKNSSTYLTRFIVTLFILFLCNYSYGQLTSSIALKALKLEYPRYKISNVQINDFSLSPSVPQDLKILSQKGLARYNYIPPGTHGYGCYGELTEVGSHYQVGNLGNEYIVMAVARVDIDRITGIREIPAMNSAEVEYTERIVKITPVGEIYSDIFVGKTSKVTATFIKYNDGWRLKELATNTKKLSIPDYSSDAQLLKVFQKEQVRQDSIRLVDSLTKVAINAINKSESHTK
ncbi:MAG: hypothetical protein WC780_16405 [Lentimicrobiaceae bacterium]|jgi:hypothetical protein